MRQTLDRPIVALDIDGTLGDYHGHFTRFAEAWIGRTLPSPDDITGGVPFYRHLGMSRASYNACKLAYRQGGMKRSMPVHEGAAEITHYFRRRGAEVWICTTRPYLRLDNIDPDTRHWLRRNHVQYDGVIYGANKYRELARLVGNRVLFVLDDLPEMVEQAVSVDLFAYMIARPYNYQYQTSANSARIGRLTELVPAFETAMKEVRNVR